MHSLPNKTITTSEPVLSDTLAITVARALESGRSARNALRFKMISNRESLVKLRRARRQILKALEIVRLEKLKQTETWSRYSS